MMYDLALLREKGVSASSLDDWYRFTTCTDLKEAYLLMVEFYDKYGFETFWAYKDQQWQAKFGRVLTLAEKQEFISNMLAYPIE